MLARLLTPRRLFALLGIVILALLAWHFGPWIKILGIAPLAAAEPRMGILIALPLLWLAWNLLADWQLRQGFARIIQGLLESEDRAPPPSPGLADERAALRAKFEHAMAAIAGSGKSDPHAIPWYLLIGQPGAGKTTLLRHCGLHFPLAAQLGADAIGGIGGTRNCDWWFAEDAVLIDTAGRFTSHDSDNAADAAAWAGFLDLLRRHRPAQPVNGVLVAISAEQLLDDNPNQRMALVETIRARLQELQRAFGLRLPVYLIVTKADLIPGFSASMADLDQGMREQVLGVTLPLTASSDAQIARCLEEGFAQIAAVAQARMQGRMDAAQSLAQRGAIFAFPHHLGRLLRACGGMAEGIFSAGRSEIRPLARGAFLTSAIPQGSGGAYFVHALLRGLVFREAPLAGRNPRRESRMALAHALGCLAALGGLAALVLGWMMASQGTRSQLDALQRQAADITAELHRAEAAPRLESEWPLLDRAARMAQSTDATGARPPLARLGLPDLTQADEDAKAAYHRLLEERLLPAFIEEAGQAIREALHRADLPRLRQLLTIYLMFGTPERYDSALVRGWVRSIIDQGFAEAPQAHGALLAHWDALERALPMAAPLDYALVGQARGRLAERPTAAQLYQQLRREAEADPATPALDITQAIGPAGAQLILMRAQASLPVIIPGIFTREGFYRYFISRLASLTLTRTANDWVMGGMQSDDIEDLQRLVDDIATRYVSDYSEAWQAVLEQVVIRNFAELHHATAALSQFASPQSPLARLIALLALHTELGPPPLGEAAIARMSLLLRSNAGPGQRAPWPGNRIRAPFVNLVAMTDTRAGPAPIARVQSLAAAALAMAQGIDAAPSPPAAAHAAAARKLAGSTSDALSNLQSLAASLPSPVAGVMGDVATRSWNQITRLALDHFSAAWRRDVLPVCERSIAGRFPIERGAERDVALRDFRAFFGPDGTVNHFVRTHLDPFLQWRGNGYVATTADGVTMRLSREVLDNLARARAVLPAFYASGNTTGNVQFRFTLTPRIADANGPQALLDIDTLRIADGHEQSRPVEITWPSSSDASMLALTLSGSDGTARSTRLIGPWALFRVLQRSGGRDAYSLNFEFNGMSARYALSPNPGSNPMAINELQEFRCNPRF
ncbi:type VI secretion system membrane subunit TssM [Rhodovarius sp.]|uniref:type VI secretion system membrane subunit TssM n=1 Tax=Rhodovarius sp. TaxID=2972673 RepID=UPI00334190D0